MAKTNFSAVGKRSKRRGNTYERRCAKLLTEFTGVGFRRVPTSGAFNKQGTTVIREELFYGDCVCDREDFLFCIEAKNQKAFNFQTILKNPATACFTAWWYQCCRDATLARKTPMLFFKPDNQADFVAVPEKWYDLGWYTGPHFKIDCYRAPLTIKLKKEDPVTVGLPTPYVINWKDLIENVDSGVLFGKDI
jgi:hypothetical protein